MLHNNIGYDGQQGERTSGNLPSGFLIIVEGELQLH